MVRERRNKGVRKRGDRFITWGTWTLRQKGNALTRGRIGDPRERKVEVAMDVIKKSSISEPRKGTHWRHDSWGKRVRGERYHHWGEGRCRKKRGMVEFPIEKKKR